MGRGGVKTNGGAAREIKQQLLGEELEEKEAARAISRICQAFPLGEEEVPTMIASLITSMDDLVWQSLQLGPPGNGPLITQLKKIFEKLELPVESQLFEQAVRYMVAPGRQFA